MIYKNPKIILSLFLACALSMSAGNLWAGGSVDLGGDGSTGMELDGSSETIDGNDKPSSDTIDLGGEETIEGSDPTYLVDLTVENTVDAEKVQATTAEIGTSVFNTIAVTDTADFAEANKVKVKRVVQPYSKITSFSTGLEAPEAITEPNGHFIVTASVGGGEYAKVKLPSCTAANCEAGSILKLTCAPTSVSVYFNDLYGSPFPAGCSIKGSGTFITNKFINKYGSLVTSTNLPLNRTTTFRAIEGADMGRTTERIWVEMN